MAVVWKKANYLSLSFSMALIPDKPMFPMALAIGPVPQWEIWRVDGHLAPAVSRASCSALFPLDGYCPHVSDEESRGQWG